MLRVDGLFCNKRLAEIAYCLQTSALMNGGSITYKVVSKAAFDVWTSTDNAIELVMMLLINFCRQIVVVRAPVRLPLKTFVKLMHSCLLLLFCPYANTYIEEHGGFLEIGISKAEVNAGSGQECDSFATTALDCVDDFFDCVG